jgi:hypothetical protein
MTLALPARAEIQMTPTRLKKMKLPMRIKKDLLIQRSCSVTMLPSENVCMTLKKNEDILACDIRHEELASLVLIF